MLREILKFGNLNRGIMIKKFILCNFILFCIAFSNGCGTKSIQSKEGPTISEPPTMTITPALEPTEAAVEAVNEVQTETEQPDNIELKALHVAEFYEGGKIFEDISKNDIKFFQDTINKLTIPDAREGERAKNILEGEDWNKGLILLNSIPKKNIYLYGYNDEEHFGFGLIMDVGKKQHIYSFPFRSMTTTAIAPSISINEENSKIFVTCLTGTGTGVSVSELYVFQLNDGLEPFYLDINKLVELFNNRITMSYHSKNKIITVFSEGKQIATDHLITNDVTPTQFYCGNFIRYRINNDTVKVICQPSIIVKERPIDSYLKNYSLEAEVKFEYDSNGKITGFDLGDITAVNTNEIDDSDN